MAFIAGSLTSKAILPTALVNDQLIDLLAGGVFVAAASAWAWIRAKLSHSKFFAVASDPRVPDAVARVQ